MNKPHAHIRSDIVAQRLAKSKELKRHFAHDVAMLSVTAALISTMQAQRVTRTELADRIGKSKAFVSQVLSGSRNMTLRTIADIALALGKELCGMQLRDIGTTQVSADAMNNHLDHWHSHAVEVRSSTERTYETAIDAAPHEVTLA